MKIAHLTTVDLSLRYLLLPQLEAASEVGEVLGISAPGDFVAELEERGIRHVSLEASTRGMKPLADIRSAVQLWRILRRERVDLLHTHNPKPGLYGRVVGRVAGVPIIVNTVHGLYATADSSLARRAIIYALEWLASRFSDAELIQNPEDFELMVRLRMSPPAKTTLLGNGVDLNRFSPRTAGSSRQAIRSSLGISDDQIVVGMVGRLVAEKGLPELVAAAERLDPRYVVLVVGPYDPEKADAVTADLIRRGEEAGVRFLGMRQDVEQLYGSFDLFVLPSHREGFPRAAMEAAASGLPVLATDIRGCRQVVDSGVNGHLFPVGDVGRLVCLIEELGENPERREEMGRQSVSRSLQHFDERRVVEIVMTTYRRLADEKGLGWAIDRAGSEAAIRPAAFEDARPIAELHRRMIGSGFLSTLSNRFLMLLYRALIESPSSSVLVAESSGDVVGFVSGTTDTGSFYRDFLRHHWLPAAWHLLPSLLRFGTWRRLVETLRYGSVDGRVAAELLSMAVAPRVQKSGLGKRLVDGLLDWATSQGVTSMKVVVSSDLGGAMRLYQRCGFVDGRPIEVHRGAPSWEFIWSA